MVVHYLDVDGIGLNPTEADPPLDVNPNAVLAQPVTRESLKTISGNCSKIEQRSSRVDLVEFPFCHGSYYLEPPAEFTAEDLLGLPIPE